MIMFRYRKSVNAALVNTTTVGFISTYSLDPQAWGHEMRGMRERLPRPGFPNLIN